MSPSQLARVRDNIITILTPKPGGYLARRGYATLEGFGMHRTIFEFRYMSMNAKRRMLALVLFGQEFQLTLTGVNQTPNVHLGLGPLGVEIQRGNSPR
jgi:hypothetical protein